MPKLILLIQEKQILHSRQEQGYSVSITPTKDKNRFSFGKHPDNYLKINGLLDFHSVLSYSSNSCHWLLSGSFFNNSLLVNGFTFNTPTHILKQNDIISYNNISITICFLEN